MAKVTRKVVTTSSYVLEINELEADALNRILYKVGGSPDTSYRKYARDIRNALMNAGLPSNYDPSDLGLDGRLFFTKKL